MSNGKNPVSEMTGAQAGDLLNDISDALGIGTLARNCATIKQNVNNAIRRSRCLSAIESHFTTTSIGLDGEEEEYELLNWGEDPKEYIETFKQAITTNNVRAELNQAKTAIGDCMADRAELRDELAQAKAAIEDDADCSACAYYGVEYPRRCTEYGCMHHRNYSDMFSALNQSKGADNG